MKAKNRNYEFGDMTFKCFFRPVGFGYEVGITYNSKPVFFGNFVHKSEALYWWRKMTTEMSKFCKHYDFIPTASKVWYTKFVSNHIYKTYYTFLDQWFNKHTKTYKKAAVRDLKNYKKIEKRYFHHFYAA